LLINHFSRKNEYQADRFVSENYSSDHLSIALLKLSRKNLSNLNPHPWYIFVYYSHPTLIQRLKALKFI
jgi:STE24 endopeptidase